jgi:hypothetical protein
MPIPTSSRVGNRDCAFVKKKKNKMIIGISEPMNNPAASDGEFNP